MYLPNSLKSFLAVAALLGTAVVSSYAGTVTLDVSAYGDLNGYGGGEFTAFNTGLNTSGYSSKALIDGGFETFCMAYNEEFTPGNWGGPNYSFTLGSAVLSNTGAAPEALTAGTAWLYSEFVTGNLAGYDYSTGSGSGRATSAEDLQEAIWWLQSSPGAPAPAVNDPFVTDALNAFGGSATAAMTAANGTNSDGVSIMVLTNTNGSYAQPQLYYSVPDAGSTLAFLSLGLVAVAMLRRRLVAAPQA